MEDSIKKATVVHMNEKYEEKVIRNKNRKNEKEKETISLKDKYEEIMRTIQEMKRTKGVIYKSEKWLLSS